MHSNHRRLPSAQRTFLNWSAALMCLLLALPAPAQETPAAQSAPAAQAAAPKRYAMVWRLHGDVFAAGADDRERQLKLGDAVFVGEKIRAADNSEAVLRTADGGMIAVRPKAQFSAEIYVAEGKKSDGQGLRLLTGSLRLISGWIGLSNRTGNVVRTSTATIGIRGTDHEPYELSLEMANALSGDTRYKPGTYDKVNRGGTTLSIDDQGVDIDAGRAGFAPRRTRALMTMLLPVLLDKVPDFYVPGQFDAELDQYSKTADAENVRELKALRAQAQSCDPDKIARAWLKQLDTGLARRDGAAILSLFAQDVTVKATVKSKDGTATTLDLTREEMVDSTLTAVKSLKGYKQRRLSIAGFPDDKAAACTRVLVTSSVVEQGKMNGKSYRFESREEFALELRDGKWLAVKAETVQR